jgi:hypothetical protein
MLKKIFCKKVYVFTHFLSQLIKKLNRLLNWSYWISFGFMLFLFNIISLLCWRFSSFVAWCLLLNWHNVICIVGLRMSTYPILFNLWHKKMINLFGHFRAHFSKCVLFIFTTIILIMFLSALHLNISLIYYISVM